MRANLQAYVPDFVAMKLIYTLPVFLLLVSLAACGRHPAAGVWQASESNAPGISSLRVGFDGRAEFEITKPEPASWRCFWAATGEREAKLDCRSSLQPDITEHFVLQVKQPLNGPQRAELKYRSQTVDLLLLQNENPTPVK